jgi:hypothetical protein
MSADVTSTDVVDQYLKRLRHALRRVRSEEREDYLSQISEHLEETRVPGDSLEQLVHRVGSPETLAQEFYAAERAKLSRPRRIARWFRRWWIVVIIIVILVASIPVYTWASQYQPLSLGMNGGYKVTVVSFDGAPAKKLVGGFSAPITWELTHGHYRLSILFDATNTNSLPVGISPVGSLVNGFPNPVTWHLENSEGALSPFVSAQAKDDVPQEILFSETYVCSSWPKGSPNAHGTSSTFVTSLPILETFWWFQHTVQLAVQPFYLEFAGNCFTTN